MPTQKMDPKLVSSQPWEMAYLHKKYKISLEILATVKAKVGRSRRKIVAELIDPKYQIDLTIKKKLIYDELANGK